MIGAFCRLYFVLFIYGWSFVFAQKDIQEVIHIQSKAINAQIRELGLDPTQTIRIAVFDFEYTGEQKNTELTYRQFENYLTDQFIVHIMKNKGKTRYDIVERSQINKIIREQDFMMTDYVNQDEALRVGKLLGASIILVGRYQDFKSYIQITTKLIEVESGKLIFVSSEEIKVDKRVDELLGISAYLQRLRLKEKEEQRRLKEENQSQIHNPRSEKKFFGAGISGFYSWATKKKYDAINTGGTVDVYSFFHHLRISMGYSYLLQSKKGSDYIVTGASFKLSNILNVGYRLGIRFDTEKSVEDLLSEKATTIHTILWTPLEGENISLGFIGSRMNKINFIGINLGFYQ